MGPSIIFDKSVVHSMNKEASCEVSNYFWANITPLLALEILGDLKKAEYGPDRARKTVQQIARRLSPIDSHVNMDALAACTSSLLGLEIPMRRTTLVDTAYRIQTASGAIGGYFPQHPVADALLRWSYGDFDNAEEQFSEEWRQVHRGFDADGLKRRLRRPVARIRSLPQLRETVDTMMADRDIQRTLLDWFLEQLPVIAEVPLWTRSRWINGNHEFIRSFAPYAHHCLRIELFFSIGLQHELIGTRPTNRLDMQYFWYTPFAQVFSSRDNLHRELSPFLLDADQTFADGDQLVDELKDLGRRRSDARAVVTGDDEPAEIEPQPGSLIHSLWEKHIGGGFTRQCSSGRKADPGDRSLPPKVEEFLEAIRETEKKIPPPPRWPI